MARCAAQKCDELASPRVWMAPGWQEITSRAAQKSLAVMRTTTRSIKNFEGLRDLGHIEGQNIFFRVPFRGGRRQSFAGVFAQSKLTPHWSGPAQEKRNCRAVVLTKRARSGHGAMLRKCSATSHSGTIFFAYCTIREEPKQRTVKLQTSPRGNPMAFLLRHRSGREPEQTLSIRLSKFTPTSLPSRTMRLP
jgi:hypothetical protein